MYETHFGLKKRPFRAHAAGTDVFVGPQTAATMAGLKKGLAAPDSIIAVSGPVGVGKTTLVRRALAAVGNKQVIISVGRMQLGHDEVLELLLEEMGAKLPAGTVQRFTSFRRMLKQHAEQGSRIIVVVEDASRIGADALSELEALTAADAGVSDGANIVLMGDPQINEVLNAPQLARLKQRLRLRQSISSFSTGELTGYFKHCFRLAGCEFDTIFAEGTSGVLHALSDGIPRMANNLVESVLTTAAESKVDQVTIDLIERVANDEYGLTVDPITAAHEVKVKEPDAEPIVAPPAVERRLTERRAETAATASDNPPRVPEIVETPVAATHAEALEAPAEADNDDDAIPELIQDTLPDLAILAPALANAPDAPGQDEPQMPDTEAFSATSDAPANEIPTLSSSLQLGTPDAEPVEPAAQPAPEPEPVPAPKAVTAPAATPQPEPQAELAAALAAAQVEAPEEAIPEWERDPTLAQLRPDLDALEHAMAVAQGLAPASDEDTKQDNSGAPPEKVPEITLDREIQAKIDEAAELLKEVELEAAARAESEADESPATQKPTAEILAQHDNKPATKSVEAQFDTAKIPLPPAAESSAAPVVEPPVLPVLEASPDPVAATSEAGDEQPAKTTNKANPELQKIAVNLARAKTIDDVDDKMAETLFGEEFSLLAAEVAANAPPEMPANDELELALDESASVPVANLDNAALVKVEIPSEPKLQGENPDLGATQQRLATVRALNSSPEPALPVVDHVVMAENEPTSPPPVPGEQPESFEEQIGTSITQTLKALNVRPPVEPDDDDDDDDEKGGFFSRFRRS